MKKKKHDIINSIASPFSTLDSRSFSQLVLQMMLAITRAHTHKKVYESSDFKPGIWDFFESTDSKDRLLNIDDLPKQYHELSIDSMKYGSEAVDALVTNLSPGSVRQNNAFKKAWASVSVTDEEWYEMYGDVIYDLNSIGLRSFSEVDDLIPYQFIPVFGCSHTYGMGIPETDLWYNQIPTNLPIFNCSVIAAGPLEVYLLLKQLYKEKRFDTAYVCIPHSERVAFVSDKRIIEGGVMFKNYFNHLDHMNNDTESMYSHIAITAIENFCKANKIKLHMYCKTSISTAFDFVKWDLIGPPRMKNFKSIDPRIQYVDGNIHTIDQIIDSVARDKMHFGRNWHRAMAKYMLLSG